MCGIKQLKKKKVYTLQIFETDDGFLVMLVNPARANIGNCINGKPKKLRKKILWLNAKHEHLGVCYNEWALHKRIMAHVRISVYCLMRFFEKSLAVWPVEHVY